MTPEDWSAVRLTAQLAALTTLLLLMGPQGPVGQLTEGLGLGRLPFTFAGLVVASVLYSMPLERNQLAGTVSRIERGAVSSLVVLTLPGGGGVITASVTNEGVEALGLAVGVPATAVFKAYAVMVAAQP